MATCRAALFDMDRTLIRKETASLYIRYQRDRGEATWKDAVRVAWWVAQYTAGIIDAPGVAARAIRYLEGTTEAELARKCAEFFPHYVAKHVCDRGREAVIRHRAAGDVVAIATGASPYAARPLADLLGIDHIVTSELEVTPEGHFTGKLILPLCTGEGKVIRTRRLAKELDFDIADATFYSDSYTDLPLLLLVREPVVINPDPRLRRFAKQRGWRIERW